MSLNISRPSRRRIGAALALLLLAGAAALVWRLGLVAALRAHVEWIVSTGGMGDGGLTVVIATALGVAAVGAVDAGRRRLQSDGRPKALPEVRRAARSSGAWQAAAALCVFFPGLATTRVAEGLGVGSDSVTQAATFASIAIFILTLLNAIWRGGPGPKWRTVAWYGTAVPGLIYAAIGGNGAAFTIGMITAVAPVMVLSRILPELGKRFRALKQDGTYRAKVRMWQYLILTVGLLLIGSTASGRFDRWQPGSATFDGWQRALFGLAVLVAVMTVWLAISRDVPRRGPRRVGRHYRPEDGARAFVPEAETISLADLWRVLRVGELVRGLIALGCSAVMGQVVWLGLEPWLTEVGLLTAAPIAYAVMGGTRMVALNWIDKYGRMTDYRLRRASALSAAWMVASGALAFGTLAPIPVPLKLVAAGLAIAALEFGIGPFNNSQRTYATRLAVEADMIASLALSGAAVLGAWSASMLTWEQSVPMWAAFGVVAFVATRRRTRKPEPSRDNPPLNDNPELVASFHVVWVYRLTQLQLHFKLGEDPPRRKDQEVAEPSDRPPRVTTRYSKTTYVNEGDVFVVETPASSAKGAPWVRNFKVVWAWGTEPRRPWRRRGLLWPGARIPVVTNDNEVVATLVWAAWFGWWRRVEETERHRVGFEPETRVTTEIRSVDMARTLWMYWLKYTA